jgi:hypothetical protein
MSMCKEITDSNVHVWDSSAGERCQVKVDSRKPLELTVGDNVRRDNVPKWFRDLIARTHHIGMRRPSGKEVANWLRRHGHTWIDHWGVGEDGSFISEPYGMTSAGTANLVAFCQTIGCAYKIIATSSWCPTRTLRVVISPATTDGHAR